ncbi:hypothetical protein D4764_07G0000430 [Takifugu flavidus]|uniref:Uncharacterized protein n=1 Tax=Takifugu flavidus TaxID=433684 RepID=A0A5C6MPV5_9TELE|nr:hypothetical protein D4764_07G0000430 [Takifugu flavidus]
MASWVEREEKGGGQAEDRMERRGEERRGEERRGEERKGEEKRRRGEERRGEERRGEERRGNMTEWGVTEACQVIIFLDPSSLAYNSIAKMLT